MKRAGILIAIAMVLCGAWMGWAGFSGNGGGYVPSPVGQSGKVPVSNGTTYDMTTLSSLGGGDVIGPATNSDGYLAQWNGADSKTLKNGLGLDSDLSSVSASDDTVPSAKATKSYVDTQDGTLVPKSLYDAQTVLHATSDNTPAALTVTEQTVVGRATGGNIAAIAIDSDITAVSANDDTVPSAKATKTYADTKIASSYLDTDGTLAANSDSKVATQKAVKTYADNMLLKSIYDAYSIIYADTDNTPAALTVAASRLVGRGSSGGIAALSAGAGLSIGASSIVVDIHGVTEETTPASDDEILIYDTSESALRRMTRGNFVSGLGVGGSTILDLGDNGVNESTAIGEIATLNDTNSIFTEPAADKLLIDVSKKWPATNAADALAANGANCSAGQFPLGVDAAGAVESCTALPTTIAGTTNQIAASASTGAITLSIPNSPTLPGTTTGSFSGPLTGNVTGNVSGTAGSLAANGANCSAGYAPLGVDASGAVESCFQVQPYDAELLAIAGLTSAADRLPYFTGSGTASLATFTSFARTLMDDTNSTDAQTTLALVPGTNVQTQNANLQAIAGLTSSANVMPYFTGSGTAATTSLSAFGRTLIDDADAPTALSTLTAAGLAANNTFTGNNVFGNGDTDTLTIQSMVIGGNSRAVQIAASLATPTYATGTDELYVAGDIETPANIYAGSISTGLGTNGSRRIDMVTNTAFTCSGNQLYFLNNAFYVCENGTAKDVPMATDSITWSGATFSLAGVTNLTLPTAAPDATGEVGGWEANGWGTSHGSYKIYDGTSAVRIVATAATDSPSNGQVPKWNTGGTITWEDDNSAGTPTLNSISDPTGDTTLTFDAEEEISLQYTGNFTTGSQFLIQQQTGNPSGGTLFEVRGADADPVLAKFGDGTNGIQITPGGAMAATGSGSISATLLSPVDSTDTTTWVAIFDTQTGSQAIKTDGGLAYNASTGVLSATGFSGPLTGNVTGNCSGSAATLTGTLANVASSTLANLATVLSDEGTGVITAMGSATNGASGIVTLAESPGTPDGTKFLRDDRTWQAVLSNPMTTQYDLIYGGASGTPTRVATSSGFITAIQSALNGAGGLITYGNASGTAAVLTGLTATSGALSESDTILQGLGKLVYQLSLSDNQVLGQYGGTKGGLAIDGDLASVSTNHDTVPSAKATQAYVDSGTTTMTNKTLDANGTGNVLKGYSYVIIPGQAWRNYGAGVTAPSTTATSELYNLPKFVNSTDEATNYIDYVITVPPDIDTAVDLTATLAFRLGGADTGDHDYVLSMCNPAASAVTACTPANGINLTFTADGSGADGDVEYTGETTLTNWKSNMTAGRRLLLRLARDGDDGTNDASTVDSYPDVLTIKYGYTN